VLAARTHNVLQEGIVRYTLADRTWDLDRRQAITYLDAADASFTAARADRWYRRAQDRRARRG
jgi:hypothetical protein